MDIVRLIALKFPNLRKNIRIAHLRYTPEQFVKRSLRLAGFISVGLVALAFFLFSRDRHPVDILILLIMVSILSFFGSFLFLMMTPSGYIKKRQREIDKDVLFAGRFILVKLESGTPMFNTLIDASRGYGVAGKYFKEIVDEINTGTPMEVALTNARTYSSSERFKKIIWQIVLALKTGTEVSGALRNTLHSITVEQQIEIKAYGKKLSSVLLFYMVLAVVMPSLGLAMTFILASIIGITITTPMVYIVLFSLAVFQLSFVFIIKSIRPAVDL